MNFQAYGVPSRKVLLQPRAAAASAHAMRTVERAALHGQRGKTSTDRPSCRSCGLHSGRVLRVSGIDKIPFWMPSRHLSDVRTHELERDLLPNQSKTSAIKSINGTSASIGCRNFSTRTAPDSYRHEKKKKSRDARRSNKNNRQGTRTSTVHRHKKDVDAKPKRGNTERDGTVWQLEMPCSAGCQCGTRSMEHRSASATCLDATYVYGPSYEPNPALQAYAGVLKKFSTVPIT